MDEFARATTKPNQGDAVTSTETPAAPAKKPAGTEYVVLGTYTGGPAWQVLGGAEATSAEAAIRQWYDRHGSAIVEPSKVPTQLVAIPARSWKPVRVKVEQIARVTLEDA